MKLKYNQIEENEKQTLQHANTQIQDMIEANERMISTVKVLPNQSSDDTTPKQGDKTNLPKSILKIKSVSMETEIGAIKEKKLIYSAYEESQNATQQGTTIIDKRELAKVRMMKAAKSRSGSDQDSRQHTSVQKWTQAE